MGLIYKIFRFPWVWRLHQYHNESKHAFKTPGESSRGPSFGPNLRSACGETKKNQRQRFRSRSIAVPGSGRWLDGWMAGWISGGKAAPFQTPDFRGNFNWRFEKTYMSLKHVFISISFPHFFLFLRFWDKKNRSGVFLDGRGWKYVEHMIYVAKYNGGVSKWLKMEAITFCLAYNVVTLDYE